MSVDQAGHQGCVPEVDDGSPVGNDLRTAHRHDAIALDQDGGTLDWQIASSVDELTGEDGDLPVGHLLGGGLFCRNRRPWALPPPGQRCHRDDDQNGGALTAPRRIARAAS